MKLSKYFTIFTVFALLTGCSSSSPEILTVCERNEIGNFIIKWEVNPFIEGQVKIYLSNDPDNFGRSEPIIYANISDGMAIYFTKDYSRRHYFKLVFNDKYEKIVTSRVLAFDRISNFRDMGGYTTHNGKSIRWGKVFRSGSVAEIMGLDSVRLKNLGLRTIIDLRAESEIEKGQLVCEGTNIIKIPVPYEDASSMLRRLEEGSLRQRDAFLYMQDCYLHYIDEYAESFSEALHVFADKNNYPILIHGQFGKDRVGFLSLLLMYALDISETMIKDDYSLSAQYIDYSKIAPYAQQLSNDSQEAITVLLSSRETFINPTLQKIKNEYGSVENYLSEKLKFTTKEREALKDILLY